MAERFAEMKSRGEKIAALTSYDATFARAQAAAGIDLLLVGDSLGMVVQGAGDTTGVTMADVEYHTRCVSAGAGKAFVMADMPYGSFQGPEEQTVLDARRLLYAGAGMVKIEGGRDMAQRISQVAGNGVPVCGHIGLLPQSHDPGKGGRRQAVDSEGIRRLAEDAKAVAEAGASLIVLEMVSVEGARAVADAVGTPTIGIGSGPGCDGQILVMHDMLGLPPRGRDKPLRFVRDFLAEAGGVTGAFAAYRAAVKSGEFPSEEHSFSRAG